MSLNGKIADEHGDFSIYSSEEDKKWLAKKIDESDVIVVGKNTYDQHLKNKKGNKKPLIVFTRSVDGLKIDEEKNSEIHFFHDNKEELLNLCDLLQYDVITVLGGAEIYQWFLDQKMISNIYLTVEPIVFGKGKNLLSGNFVSEQKNWKLKSSQKLNEKGTLLLHYQVL